MMYRSIAPMKWMSLTPIQQTTTQIHDLRVLEDDKSYFPPYHALPLVLQETLNEYPELEEVLGLLEGIIDEEAMQIMNGKVDNDGMMVETVAQEFLIESGLIEKK